MGLRTALRLLLEEAVRVGIGSGAEVLVLQGGEERARVRVGQAAGVPAPRPLSEPAWWDLASLTKPLVGAAVALALVEEGELAFEEEVRARWDAVHPGVTLAQLLSHSAGYRPWRALHEEVDAWGTPEVRRRILELAARDPLVAEPGTRHAYSDLGFLALCGVLERAGGERIDRLWEELVATPAGASELAWGHPDAASTRVTDARGPLRGVADDDNCAAMGGISTHAGLFGTARGVAGLAQAFLDGFHGRGALSWEALRVAWTTRGAGSHFLGWDGRSGPSSSSGSYFPEDSVGHLGYTGTSLWIAPSWELLVVLLTNRVHPSETDERHRDLRRAVHDAVAAHLGRG